jgi:hypothetical protein
MTTANKNSRLKPFHATMVVTRLEEWCVEAETPEEARALLASGQGHRCQLGDCLHVQLEAMEDAASGTQRSVGACSRRIDAGRSIAMSGP